MCCDWLPERARWRYLGRSGYGLCPASTQIMLWCFLPYNKSFIDQACSIKMDIGLVLFLRLSIIVWSSRRKAQCKLIIRRSNVVPCGATLQAWWRWPISDSSSAQKCFANHSSNSVTILSLLSAGRRAWSFSEWSSIPRIVRRVAGPSSLSGWSGRPSPPHNWTQVWKLL